MTSCTDGVGRRGWAASPEDISVRRMSSGASSIFRLKAEATRQDLRPSTFDLRPSAFGLWPLGLWPLAFGLWPLAFGLWPLALTLTGCVSLQQRVHRQRLRALLGAHRVVHVLPAVHRDAGVLA